MSDELAPFFESRESRLARLPVEARGKLEVAAKAATANGETDFEDRQFVSLWLARRTGMARQDILTNFEAISGRFFGPGATAAKAWDEIAKGYQAPGETEEGTEIQGKPGQAGTEQEYADTEAMPKAGHGFALANVGQGARAAAGGFNAVAQQVPAGLYSQASVVAGAPGRPKSPFENKTFLDLTREKEQMLRPPFWPHAYPKALNEREQARVAKIDADLAVLTARTDEENRKRLKDFAGSESETVSKEYRRLAGFWADLSQGASERMGVDPEFKKTAAGQLAASAGSLPATVALAVLGLPGAVGLESMFYAQAEQARQEKEGAAYDPEKAAAGNVATALPQMVIERAFGVERLMNKVLGELPKMQGKVAFGDFAKLFFKRGLRSGVEEGITEPTQGFWEDYVAGLTYDEKRELVTGDGAKRRLLESVSGFALGFLAGGGVTSLQAVDQNRAVAAGQRYLTTKDGQPLAEPDFRVLRTVKSDREILATAPDEETGRVLIAAVNGDVKAQASYNNRVLDALFVDTEGVDVGGAKLGEIDGVPFVKDADGTILALDVTDPEHRNFLENFKREAVKVKTTEETLAELEKRHGAALEASQPDQLATLQDRVKTGQITQEQADDAIEVAKVINGLAADASLADVAPEGSATAAKGKDGLWKMVVEVAKSADPTKAIEEVSEAYIHRAYREQNLVPADLQEARLRWHQENGESDVAAGFDGEALDRANVEWFSKRVIDYALANRKTELPGGWGKWLRTLGRQLKQLLGGATRMRKLMRDGKLDPELEAWMKGALGSDLDTFEITGAKAADKAGRANSEAAPTVDEVEAEMLDEVSASAEFPVITPSEVNGEQVFTVTAPDGQELGRQPSMESAKNVALKWFDEQARNEERGAAEADAGQDPANELQAVIRRLGGLKAASKESIFGGELRAVAENMTTAQRLRVFRLRGMDLDTLREALTEEGFAFETVTDVLAALDESTRGTPVYGTGAAEAVTFSLAEVKQSKELIAVHNTSAEKLRSAVDLGGFAVPSLGIVRAGVSRFTGFGDITLLAKPDMVDPKKDSAAKVFNADVYSPRFPTVRFKLDTKALDRAWKKLADESNALGKVLSSELDADEIEKNGLKEFEEAATVKMAFLKSKGITPDIRMRQVDPVSPELLKFDGSKWELTDNPDFQAALAADLRRQYEGKEYGDLLADYLDEDGKPTIGILQRTAERVVLTKKPEPDRYRTGEALTDQIEKAGLTKEFAEWVRDEFSAVIKSRVVRDYNERSDTVRMLPYDLDTVVRVMKRELRDGEGFNYGVGSIRSNVAKQFRSLKEISADARSIISPDAFEKVKEEVNDEFSALARTLAPFYKFDANRFGYLDEVSTALKELALFRGRKWGENFKDVPADVMQEVGVFMSKLGTMPTEYFEAKIQRGVKISEFAAAVIPSDTPEDVRELLATNGLKVIEYPKSDVEARAKALDSFAQDEDLTFAITGVPQNSQQALQAQLAGIRAKRLNAAAVLANRLRTGTPLPARAKLVKRTTQASLLARLAMPISSRLARIAPELAQRLRRFEYDVGTQIGRDFDQVNPFMDGVASMAANDAETLHLALMNGDVDTRDTVLAAYNLKPAFAQVQSVFASTRARAIAAGFEVGEITDYFPRKVNDHDALLAHYHATPRGGIIEEALKEAAKKAAAAGRTLTHEERVEITNRAIQGHGRTSGKPSNLKARKTDVVDVDASRFYADSTQALVSYIEQINQAVEKRRFFGKFAVPTPGAPQGISNAIALEASIGAYVEDLIATGAITRGQQAEVVAILEGRFNQQAGNASVKAFKSLSYMSTMGQVTSAMTQLTDLAFSMYESGVYNTLVSAGRAVGRQSKIDRKALGLENIAEEFRDTGRLHKLLNTTFKLVGIHYLDMIGKETLVNAKFAHLQSQAASGKLNARDQARIDASFSPADAARVISELATGQRTADTLFVTYSVLADFQPISLSEYPEYYLRHPNGRVFYMLKTFVIKQIDGFRREAFSLMVHGNAKQKAIGARNLIHLAGLLYIIGLPVDWLKDWIMGRDPQMSDLAVDNVFKLLGVNRWHLYRFRENGNPVESLLLLIAPPAPFVEYPLDDARNSVKKVSEGDEINVLDFESWRILPWLGSFIYWHAGGGQKKTEKKRLQREQAGE